MLRLRHLRYLGRPVWAVKLLVQRAMKARYRRLVESMSRSIPRTGRDRCWCSGDLRSFAWHRSYGVCSQCGCYVHRFPPSKEGLIQLYHSMESYWVLLQKAYGLPPIGSRGELYLRDGRVKSWLALIERYAPRKSQAIEVGCAPGVLLAMLRDRGVSCVGVEPSGDTAAWIRDRYGVDVRPGLFPEIDLPACDLFLAFDVLEHSEDPVGFMQKAADLLVPGGVAIIQTPINRYDLVPPFGGRFSDAFDDLEHLFLFTDQAMRELAARCHLDVVSLEERLWLLGEIAIFRKPLQSRYGDYVPPTSRSF